MQLPWRNPLLVRSFPPPLPQFFVAEFARFGERARLSSCRFNDGFGAVSERRIWFADKAEKPYAGQRQVLAQPRAYTVPLSVRNKSIRKARLYSERGGSRGCCCYCQANCCSDSPTAGYGHCCSNYRRVSRGSTRLQAVSFFCQYNMKSENPCQRIDTMKRL